VLLSTVFVLRPVEDCWVPMTLGKAIHACVMQMVRRIEPALSERLHGVARHKPFTISPLQGPFELRGQRFYLKHDREYWLRITSLEPELSHLFLTFEDHPPRFLNLLEATFTVTQVSSQPRDHSWAQRSTYAELHNLLQKHEAAPKVCLLFASPTAFRSQGQTVLLPLPRLVLSSLWERWQHYAPYQLDVSWLDELIAGVDISRYKLKTQMMDFRSYRQLGFIGECEFGARRDVSEEGLSLLRMLIEFALFAGVGYKTTMGLGQTRRVG
jgi:CRISPR-associated endoribonuclease Cas6